MSTRLRVAFSGGQPFRVSLKWPDTLVKWFGVSGHFIAVWPSQVDAGTEIR